MIACYAWTDIQIINIVNIVLHDFPKEQKDLFVLMLDRIDMGLVEEIRLMGCFEHIYMVPSLSHNQAKNREIPVLSGVGVTIKNKRFYSLYYREILNTRKYDILFTPGYWGEAIHLIRYSYKSNRQLMVFFFEEGSGHYSATLKTLCSIRLDKGLKKSIIKLIITGKFFFRINRLPQILYLYEPICRINSINLEIRSIPKINQGVNGLIDCLVRLARKEMLDKYKEKQIYFFLTADQQHYEGDWKQTRKILNVIAECVSPSNVIVKTHPEEKRSLNVLENTYSDEIFIDNQSCSFECILAAVEADKKVLISRGTSCLLTGKYLYNYEPYIIFTYKLYKNRVECENNDMQIYINGLKKVYLNPEKIVVVQTMIELEDILGKLMDEGIIGNDSVFCME